MTDWFAALAYPIQALIAAIFTWSITALGAAVVFFFKKPDKNLLDAMLGIAGGVMIAASFWSLLLPAIELAEKLDINPQFALTAGFLSGGLLLFVGDVFFENRQKNCEVISKSENKRCMMLIFSITLHNIPEGMAVGVAFGSIAYGVEGSTLAAACMLALGIGLQNFPEGSAVSLPLLREGYSGRKAFFIGQLSGIVEPAASVLGAMLVLKVRLILPFLLSFASGAMIYVVVEELIPESQTNQNKNIMALFTLLGFMLMTFLDISFG